MPAPLPLIQDWFSAVAAEMRDEIAIAHGKRLVRYAELDDLSNRLANHLLADGGLAGQRVAILSVDPVQFIIAIIGVLKAGGIFVPLDNRNPPARLRAILDEITASRILSDAALAEHARLLAPTVPVDSIEEAASGATGHPDVRHDPDAPCYVFFSSGTTGRPKGIVAEIVVQQVVRVAIGVATVAAHPARRAAPGCLRAPRTCCRSPLRPGPARTGPSP